MANPFYESILARLVQVSPLLARGILDEGLERYGYTREAVSASQMQQLIDEYLPEVLRDVDLEGMAAGVVVADDRVRFISSTLQPLLFGGARLDEAAQLRQLEQDGVLLPQDADPYAQNMIRLNLAGPYPSTVCVGQCSVPGPDGAVLRLSFVRDETLADGLRAELSQAQHALAESVREAERLARDLLRQERATSQSLQEALEAKEQALEAQNQALLQSERLASLGALLGGIAHELNNLLGPILGYSQLLQNRDLDAQGADAAGRIEIASRSAAQVVRSLLAFANPRAGDQSLGDLNQAVRDVHSLLAGVWSNRGIHASLDLTDPLEPTNADLGQLRSIVLNLASNATNAVGDGPGQLTLTTRQLDDAVQLEVTDTGGGIPDELLDQIFEPFVTTRKDTGGTGMGLNIVRGILSAAGGSVSAENIPGDPGGARFTVVVPCLQSGDHLSSVISEPGSLSDLPSLVGTSCLVVDDEPALLALVSEVLTEAGLHVETAASGLEALELMGGRAFDLVVSDVRMPGLDGLQLLDLLLDRTSSWAQHFLFITGDLLDPELKQRIEQVGARVLYKPFDIEQLLGAVQEVLGQTIDDE